MKLVIYSAYIGNAQNLRVWTPDNDEIFSEFICLDIGPKNKKESADSFSIRVATPKGLEMLEEENGILAIRPLLVMKRYNFNELWQWLEKIISICEDNDWHKCVERLRYYFDWEYDNYKGEFYERYYT